jgi:AcrR family transcriptional regulator
MPTLRSEYARMTRNRIIDGAIELIAESGGEPISIAAVAARCGIADRTVYRHFETRDELLKAVWPRMQEQVGSVGWPSTADELIDRPERLFPRFDEHEGLVRASINSATGKEMRTGMNATRQAAMLACVADAFPNLEGAAARRRAAVVQLLESADAWAVLKDFWGLDGAEAGRAAREAIAVLLGREPADAASGADGAA